MEKRTSNGIMMDVSKKMKEKRIWKMGILPRVLIAVVLGILAGLVVNEPLVRSVLTFMIL